MNVDVSPNAEALVFDLLGDIYQLPLDGGNPIALTTGTAWDQAPRFSPDGKHIYFVSDRKGHKNIWRITVSGRSLKQITQSDTDVSGGPNWSQDGSQLLVGVAADKAETVLHSIDPFSGAMTPVFAQNGPWIDAETFEIYRTRIQVYSGVASDDNKVFFSEAELAKDGSKKLVRLFEFDRDSQERTAITPVNAPYNDYKPQLSHNGELLAYYRQYNDHRTELRALNRTTGQDKVLAVLTNADGAAYTQVDDARPNYAFMPDDSSIVFWHGGKIRRIRVADGVMEIVPFRLRVEREVTERVEPMLQSIDDIGEAIIRWPSLSRDGQVMAFAAIGYVWVMDVPTGDVRRLTRSEDLEFMPAVSPDGKSVAYVSFALSSNNYGFGRLMIANTAGEEVRDVIAEPNETYLLPKWSHDGSMIAVIRERAAGSGIQAAFGWTSVVNGEFHEVAPAPASSGRASRFLYARSVGFDITNEHLLFTFRRSETETLLMMADLDGTSLRTLAIGTPEISGITPSPDLKNLALSRLDETIWIVPFVEEEGQPKVVTTTARAHQIDVGGGYYVDWNLPSQISFGFGRDFYRFRLGNDGLESLRVKVAFDTLRDTRPTAFVGARLITMSNDAGVGRLIESGAVVVDGQRITAIGSLSEVTIPVDALVVNVAGKTIMPGLLDTHYHRIGGWSYSAFKLPSADFSDESAIAFGITTAWEPGGAVNDGVPAVVDLQKAGRIAGPRWSHAASGSVGHPYDYLTSYRAALTAIDNHRELGVSVLKEYSTPTRRQQQWLSAAAHTRGLGIVSHLQSFDGTMTRIVDGYTGGDHPYIPIPFYKDVHEMLRQTGFIWTPNIVITNGTIGNSRDKMLFYCNALIQRQEQKGTHLAYADSICDLLDEGQTVTYDDHRVSRVASQVAHAARNGVHIGVSAHSMPASNLHREMWFLWRGGMAIEDVLRGTTIGNATKLGLQKEVGSLEPGKVADFLVLDENPLEDIRNTLSLRYTVQGGVVYDSKEANRIDVSKIAHSYGGAATD